MSKIYFKLKKNLFIQLIDKEKVNCCILHFLTCKSFFLPKMTFGRILLLEWCISIRSTKPVPVCNGLCRYTRGMLPSNIICL